MRKALTKLRKKFRRRRYSSSEELEKNNKEKADRDYLKKLEELKGKHTKTHLVVDDIDTNRETLSYLLHQKRIKTHQASNGAEAVEIFSRYNVNYFDVIWMDIKMPFMDGIGATTILRQRGYQGIIIMITGYINRETLLKCKLIGADKIYPKPITKDTVYEMDIFQIYM